MTHLSFPPHNPNAYEVPSYIFENGLDLDVGDMNEIDLRTRIGSTTQYHALWKHLLRSYWTEIYDKTSLKTLLNVDLNSSTDDQIDSQSEVLPGIQEVFLKLINDFEGSITTGNLADNESSFLTKNFGTEANNFYNDGHFTEADRVSIFESFLRTQEVGRRRYNIFLWVWDFLLKVMQKIQIGVVNKTLAQRWMNQAQKDAVTDMGKIATQFKKQKSGEDFKTIHLNQVLNQKLDIIRGEKGAVTRASSIKSQESGSYLQKYSETNTFLKTMIEQLESALRATMK